MASTTEAHGNGASPYKHPYHLVDPSPWPLLGAFGGGAIVLGIVLWAHSSITWMFWLGVAMTLATMFFWWRDVVKESGTPGLHSPIVRIGLRYGMTLFIASEVMFFAAFFWAFFDFSIFPREASGGVWPPTAPTAITPLDPYAIPLLNTLILLTSGCTVTWAHHALKHNDRAGLIQGLALTVLLGVLFTSFQAYEYLHAPFGFKDGIYTSTFFMATGFHGFHVIVGTVFLIVCLVRAIKGHFEPDHHFGFEAAAWYWHFVDVVWLFLFSFVYIWGSGPGPYAG